MSWRRIIVAGYEASFHLFVIRDKYEVLSNE